MSKRIPKVIVKKLQRHREKTEKKVLGMQDPGIIRIDPRQTPEEFLDTLVHETIHDADPNLTEDQVINLANHVSTVLWRENYRKTVQ